MANDNRNMANRLEIAQPVAPIGHWELDLVSLSIWASPEAFGIFGLPKSAYISLAEVRRVVHPDDRPKFDQAMALLIEKKENYNLELRLQPLADDHERIIHSMTKVEFDRNGQAIKAIGVIHDITEQKQNERLVADYSRRLLVFENKINENYFELETQKEYLRCSEEKYRVLAENSSDGIFSCDAEGRFVTANQRFYKIIAYSSGEIIGRTLNSLSRKDSFVWSWYHNFQKMIKQGKAQSAETSRENESGEICHYRLVLVPLFNKHHQIMGAIGTCHDISDIRKHDKMVSHFAYDDLLTGLPNRLFFEQSLDIAIHQAGKRGTKIAVIFLDCDNFQKINDTLGHRVGDEVLQIVAANFKSVLRKNEVLARFTGDEFSMYIPDIQSQPQIEEVLHRIKRLMNQDIQAGINSINVKISLGVAFFPDDGEITEELMKNADAAMYKAKKMGKNTCHLFDKKLKIDLLKKINIEKHLIEALTKNELFIHYQPQMDMNGKVRGCEALLRWQSQALGRRIPPRELIPAAEETSLIRPIGEWVLETACRQAKEWQNTFSFYGVISVNVSPVQLYQNNFIATVKKILADTELQPEYLELEITESVLISSFDEIIKDIEELRCLGVKIALDDFGTGFSSLNYLLKLPVDTLKIDKSFIDHIEYGAKEKAIMRFVFSLIHELQLEVIAEGVETAEQYAYLEKHQCDFIQGFLLHRPLRREEFGRLLARQNIM